MTGIQLQEWYSLFWALDVVLAALVLILFSIHNKDFAARIEKARVDLRDKLHLAMSQSLRRSAA